MFASSPGKIGRFWEKVIQPLVSRPCLRIFTAPGERSKGAGGGCQQPFILIRRDVYEALVGMQPSRARLPISPGERVKRRYRLLVGDGRRVANTRLTALQ
jgi:hypothetical protein